MTNCHRTESDEKDQAGPDPHEVAQIAEDVCVHTGDAIRPNAERSHAGPLALECNRDAEPALAAVTC